MPGSGTLVPLLEEVEPVEELVLDDVELLVLLDDELLVDEEPEVDEELDVLPHFFLQPPYHVAEAGVATASAPRAAADTRTLRIIDIPPN